LEKKSAKLVQVVGESVKVLDRAYTWCGVDGGVRGAGHAQAQYHANHGAEHLSQVRACQHPSLDLDFISLSTVEIYRCYHEQFT